jgi:hypothetical protein
MRWVLLLLLAWRPEVLRFEPVRLAMRNLNAGRLPTTTARRDATVSRQEGSGAGRRRSDAGGQGRLTYCSGEGGPDLEEGEVNKVRVERICFARMTAKTIMKMHRLKTQTRPAFCFMDMRTL